MRAIIPVVPALCNDKPPGKILYISLEWESEPYGGYYDASWNLYPRYDVPAILHEAAAAYLAAHRPLSVALGRIDGPPAEVAEA